MRAFAILIVALLLAGCATTRPGASFVTPEITAPDSVVLAADTTDYLRTIYPAANTTLALEAPADKAANALTPALNVALRDAGFAVLEAAGNAQEGQRIRYLVSLLDHGVALRLQYQGVEATRFYHRDTNGGLVAAAPFTVRETP